MELRAASGASSHMASVDVPAYAGDGHARDVQDGALHLELGLLDRVEIRAARREELEFYGFAQILERLPDDLGFVPDDLDAHIREKTSLSKAAVADNRWFGPEIEDMIPHLEKRDLTPPPPAPSRDF